MQRSFPAASEFQAVGCFLFYPICFLCPFLLGRAFLTLVLRARTLLYIEGSGQESWSAVVGAVGWSARSARSPVFCLLESDWKVIGKFCGNERLNTTKYIDNSIYNHLYINLLYNSFPHWKVSGGREKRVTALTALTARDQIRFEGSLEVKR